MMIMVLFAHGELVSYFFFRGVEDEGALDVADGVESSEDVEDEVLVVFHVGGMDFEEVVELAGYVVAFGDLRECVYGRGEVVGYLVVDVFEFDVAEYEEAVVYFLHVEYGDIFFDYAVFFHTLDTFEYGCGGEVDLLREFFGCEMSVALECAEDHVVDFVEFVCHCCRCFYFLGRRLMGLPYFCFMSVRCETLWLVFWFFSLRSWKALPGVESRSVRVFRILTCGISASVRMVDISTSGGSGCEGMVVFISPSMLRSAVVSVGVQKDSACPSSTIMEESFWSSGCASRTRPVRPIRWMYCSGSKGRSKHRTWLTPSMSMPRAMRSVAMRTLVCPSRKLRSVAKRWLWVRREWR